MTEKVLVVPRTELFLRGEFQGISSAKTKETLKIVEKKSLFMSRAEAEKDPSFKQIIPYVTITWRDQIFMVTRLATQGEARLHQKVSIGLGGHINPADAVEGEKAWEVGLKRELSEEVSLEGPWEPQLIGLLNDDSTPVGSVHFGLVYRVDLAPDGGVTIKEKDKMTGTFFAPEEVAVFFDRMETWSQLVLATFWPDFVVTAPVVETSTSS